MRTLYKPVLFGLLLMVFIGPVRAASPEHLLAGFSKTRLIVETRLRGCILFDLYVAQTPAQRSQGLMHIETLDEYEGMIFLYEQSTDISMWMKNTLISLDMLFVAADATIASVHSNAVPMSEAIISSGSPVAAVIELNGGAAERFGIQTGDRLIIPAR